MPEIDFFCDFCREEITRSQTMSWYLLRAAGVRRVIWRLNDLAHLEGMRMT